VVHKQSSRPHVVIESASLTHTCLNGQGRLSHSLFLSLKKDTSCRRSHPSVYGSQTSCNFLCANAMMARVGSARAFYLSNSALSPSTPPTHPPPLPATVEMTTPPSREPRALSRRTRCTPTASATATLPTSPDRECVGVARAATIHVGNAHTILGFTSRACW
jgi:hypothetical protein